jgi:hypothetical protein
LTGEECSWRYDAISLSVNDSVVPHLRLTVEFTKPRSKEFVFLFDLTAEPHRTWLLSLAKKQRLFLLNPTNRNVLANVMISIEGKKLLRVLNYSGPPDAGTGAKRWWRFWQ